MVENAKSDASAPDSNASREAFAALRGTRFRHVRDKVRRRYLSVGVVGDNIVARLGLAEPVVFVSGFWRSGTTWLQESLAESLGAKTIFEPLSPEGRHRRRALRRAGITNLLNERMVHRHVSPDDAMWSYLDRVFWGRNGDSSTLLCRKSPGESLRRLIVVKDVRMQFNLQGTHDRYNLPIIHIRRHPAAVVSSILNVHWGHEFEMVRLAEVLPDLDLAEYDGDIISRVSAYWAVTESFIEEKIEPLHWAKIISYEHAVANPAHAMGDICAFIGRDQRRKPNFSAQSATTANKSRSNYIARPSGWRKSLSDKHIERIRSVVAKLYPQFVFD